MGDAPMMTELAPEEHHEKSVTRPKDDQVPNQDEEKEAPPTTTTLDRTVEFPTPKSSSGKKAMEETNDFDEKDDDDTKAEKGDDKSGKEDEIDDDDAEKTRGEQQQQFEQTEEEEEEEEEEEDIDVNDWPVSDDFLLIKCVENGCALESLAENKVVNFSKEYEITDIEKRWRGILFGEKSAYEISKRLREYAEKEQPKVEANVGDDFRTSWKKKRGGEVPRLISSNADGDDDEDATNDDVNAVNFFKDAELFILTDCDPLPSKAQLDETLKRQELKRKERTIHKIAKLEKDLTTVASRAMTRSGIIAKIIGQNTMFTLTKRESTVGRSTTDSAVDVDLSNEGNAAKISRVQAYLKLRWNGEFTMRNVGKRPIWINNKPIETNQRARLHSHALIEVGGMRMLFVPNPSLVRCIQPESYK
jgi:hypothetical protein